jgi:environmental stress-induced protein Ves
MHVLRASGYRRTRWKNDGGWTTELARSDVYGDDFRWRVSIAEIERDGPFSRFAGVERDLLLLDGRGIELDVDDMPPLRLDQRFDGARFAGESSVQCRLLGGPTRDFNVMARRDVVCAKVLARPLIGPMLVFPEPGTEWFVHVLGGHAGARGAGETLALDTGDSLHVDFRHDECARIVLDGAGELVLAKFSAVAHAAA